MVGVSSCRGRDAAQPVDRVVSSVVVYPPGPGLMTVSTAVAQTATATLTQIAADAPCPRTSSTTLGPPITATDALSLPIVSFDGMAREDSCGNGGSATDDSGMIGLNHYVQTTNFGITVYDRSGKPLVAVGTTSLFGGTTHSPGLPGCGAFWTDAVVMYDRYKDRWVFTRFSFPHEGADAVSAGAVHACAALSNGGAACWGTNDFGQLGNGTTTPSTTPVTVPGLSNVKAIAAGPAATSAHSCALTNSDNSKDCASNACSVSCWGGNDAGQLGNGTTIGSTTPVAVNGLPNITAIAVGSRFTCALDVSKNVWCWGANDVQQLGDGTTVSRSTPAIVPGVSDATAIALGDSHVCALLSSGTVTCWGSDEHGQLGDGNFNAAGSPPVSVTGLGSHATALGCGASHTCATFDDGSIDCWGSNGSGQLGDGSTVDRASPVAVNALGGHATTVALGSGHSCAMLSDGTAECWGDNAHGQLGNGSTTSSLTPVAVSGLIDASSLSAGGGDVGCTRIRQGGLVQCWGFGGGGELGDGATADSSVPVGVSNIAGNQAHECFAVSQTPDPTGAYFLYEFKIGLLPDFFNDYPKTAVWPDGYYMTSNANGIRSGVGDIVDVFERDAMLTGGMPRMVQFLVGDPVPTAGKFVGAHMLPAFVDGPSLPPAGSPNYLIQIQDDDYFPASEDRLQIFAFHVDWSNPTASTLTATDSLVPEAFHSGVCPDFTGGPGTTPVCVPQPGGGALIDPIAAGVSNYRLVYRNFGTHETLLLNHTISADDDVPGGGVVHSALRTYELRRQGGPWSIFQQNTFAPDQANRFLGSIGMDGAGNIALGYNVVGTSLDSSIRYTGRQASDPPGTFPLPERSLAEGQGVLSGQSAFSYDYAEMSIDPVDDCTFWLTNGYIPADTTTNDWHTRIGSLRFSSCSPSCKPNCPGGSACTSSNDCQSPFVCTAGQCAPVACSPKCTAGQGCRSNGDCESFVCTGGQCAPPACTPSCSRGSPCGANGDCASRVCTAGQCAPPACSPKCAQGQRCGDNSDCESFVCTNGVCAPPSCAPSCNQGAPCSLGGDCLSRVCGNGQCQPPACSPRCGRGLRCANNGDCLSHVCSAGVCR
jgi:alpha-tubulin suppressor-like RCC1 family protein